VAANEIYFSGSVPTKIRQLHLTTMEQFTGVDVIGHSISSNTINS